MSTGLQADLDKLLVKANRCTGGLPKPTAPNLEGWSDAHLKLLRTPLSFPAHTYLRTSLPLILTRFYHLYFSGTIDDADNVSAVVLDVIALSETDSGRIWDTPAEGARGFYKQNMSELPIPDSFTVSALPQVQVPAGKLTPEALVNYKSLVDTYTTDNQTNFSRLVADRIRAIQVTGGASSAESRFLMLSSFLALTLYRSATRSRIQMSNAFHKVQYKGNLSAVAMWPAGHAWSPPCESCLSLCEQELKKGVKTTSHIFTILAHEFVKTQDPSYPNTEAQAFLAASVLTHTARNGLGLIAMVDLASEITRTSWQTLLRKTYFNVTAESWKTVAKFFSSYCVIDQNEYGYNWARVIDHGYLRRLSPKENQFLATLLAAIIEKAQGDGVWDAEWAQGGASDIPDAKRLGYMYYEISQPQVDQMTATAESRDLLERVKEGKIQEKTANGGIDKAAKEASWR